MSTVRFERNGNLAILRLDKARGNAIDDPLVADLLAACREAEKDDSLRGLLLASANPKLFCPGLDLISLIEYDRPSLAAFMGRFADLVWALYELRKPLVAAVNGHAVAGGCILALTADFRVLRRGGAQMGLSEVKVGVPLPWSVTVLLREEVASQALSQVALLGRNFADEAALAVGLAHELADADGFEAACLARLQEFAEKDVHAFAVTKRYLRTSAMTAMRTQEKQAVADFLDGWFSEATKRRMQETVASLLKR
ncbi:MAG TPA: enoyl-CoA hydratase/isomerase family protein [Vicinamibacteria bacterium]|nr:enoyl-CoA hydratase/isomerase family protein [Vicinamibacteria bacterium]